MNIDLVSILLPHSPPLEIFIRGTLTYLALFFMLRVTLKRQSGGLGVSDLLVIVLIADAAQNAMAGDYKSVGDGLLLVATIVGWSYALDWLGYHVPAVERIIHPGPLELIRDGRLDRAAMRHELITREEIMTSLRLQGIEDIARVKRAFLEGNGELTVVPVDGQPSKGGKDRRDSAA